MIPGRLQPDDPMSDTPTQPLPTADPQEIGGKLLLIDDDRELCELLLAYLHSAGLAAEACHTPSEGVRRATGGEYAAVILDVMMPEFDGFEALRRIRAVSRIPVVMLTARGEDIDRIIGLEIGADDYLPKPFNPRELVARLRAVLRRAGATARTAPPEREPPLVVADLRMDVGARSVTTNLGAIELTGTEFELLEVLVRAAGRVVSRDELCRRVLGRRLLPEDRSVDVHVSNIRKKLGKTPGGGERIKTLRGTGYVLALAHADAEADDEVSGDDGSASG
jgi:two-component system, OmpR family, response regulator CpxR